LEPDGELYVCLDMADGKHYPIGNAIKEEIYTETFKLLINRTAKLNNDCLICEYFSACQGGCMNESIEQNHGVFGKTDYCSTWKKMFSLIDNKIEEYGEDEVRKWIKKLRI
jgi:radical SAM protein with 4Fe4S-binding SPASM domain